MSNNTQYTKADFIRFMMSTIEHDSSDKEKAKEYLSAQGLNVDSMVSDGIKRLKRIQMQIQAEKTKAEMQSEESIFIKQKAKEWVENLLSNAKFSLAELIKEEELTMSFRNIEYLSQNDVKNILVKHFILKFREEQKNKSNGL